MSFQSLGHLDVHVFLRLFGLRYDRLVHTGLGLARSRRRCFPAAQVSSLCLKSRRIYTRLLEHTVLPLTVRLGDLHLRFGLIYDRRASLFHPRDPEPA